MIRIISYTNSDPATPIAMRWAAAMVPLKDTPGSHWMAWGATESDARGKLETMWLREHPAERVAKVVEALDDLV